MGKMLVAFGGALSGYNGTFEFTSGEKYPEELNYTGMRLFLASFGAMMVPMAFMTMIELGFTRRTAALAAVMVLCGRLKWRCALFPEHLCMLRFLKDNALLSISRYILLDSMLLYFTTQTVYCMTVFHRMDRTEYVNLQSNLPSVN